MITLRLKLDSNANQGMSADVTKILLMLFQFRDEDFVDRTEWYLKFPLRFHYLAALYSMRSDFVTEFGVSFVWFCSIN